MPASRFSPWPCYSEEEVAAVAAVLRSNRVNYWTGTIGREFETAFATWTGNDHAIALANGTVALDLALKGLGIGPGDEVIVSPRSFIASVSCVLNAGATPVFADVDADSGTISPATIAPVLTPRSRAILPVHLGGWPCDMTGIMALAGQHGLVVIEDCAQAHGAMHRGKSVGSFGHAGAWSFCQDKIMTTGGEGGMITCDDKALWARMWSYKDHGKDWDAVYTRSHPPGFRWVHESIGTNWRMPEMQAALGRIQLGRMPEWTARRTAIARRLASSVERFAGALRLPMPPDHDSHAYYRLYAYVRPEGLKEGWSRDRIVAGMAARGLPLFHGSCPEIYLEKAFDGLPCRPAAPLPNARLLGETSLMFLTHPTLRDEEVEEIAAGFEAVCAEAAR